MYLDLGSIGYSLELKKDGSWDSGIKGAEKNLRTLGSALTFNQKELDKLQREMFTTSAKMRELESTTGKTSAEYKKQEARLTTLKKKYAETEAATSDLKTAMDKAGGSSTLTATKFADNAKKMGGSMMSAGRTMTMGITLPLVAMSALAIKLGSDFESTMNQVQASTSASADEMDGLRDLALQMGADTVFSAGQAGEAMLELSKAGMTSAQVKAGALEAALLLAAAGGLELGDAANVTASALKQFNLPASDAAIVANALAGGANQSIASVESLRESLQQGGSVADAFGQSINGTVGALALMADKGIAGSDAGTSFKSMLLNLIPQTDKQIAAFDKLGLSFVNSKGEFDDITVVAQKLKDKMGGLTEAQRNSTLEVMFGSDAMRAAIVMTGAGAAGVQTYVDATLDQAAASDMAEARMKGMKGAMESMRGSVETAAISFGTVLAPVVLALSDKIKRLADWFTALTGQQKNTALAVAVFAAVIGPLVFGIGAVVVAVGSLTSALVAMGVTAGVATGGISILLGALAVFTAAGVAKYVSGLDGLTGAQRNLRDAQDAAATAARNHKDALDVLAGKSIDTREATLNAAEANNAEAEARKAQTAALKNHGAKSKEYKDATAAVERAVIAAARAERSLTQAVKDEDAANKTALDTGRKTLEETGKLAAAKALAADDKSKQYREEMSMMALLQSEGRTTEAARVGQRSRERRSYLQLDASAKAYGKSATKAEKDLVAARKDQAKALADGGVKSAAYKSATDKVKVAEELAAIAADKYRKAAEKAAAVDAPTGSGLAQLRDKWSAVARAAERAAAAAYNASRPAGSHPVIPGGSGIGLATGGRAYGPTSGYPVTLHGIEDVISYDPRYKAANIVRAANALASLTGGEQGSAGTVTNINVAADSLADKRAIASVIRHELPRSRPPMIGG